MELRNTVRLLKKTQAWWAAPGRLPEPVKRAIPRVLLFLCCIYLYSCFSAWAGSFNVEHFLSQPVELVLLAYLFVYLWLIQKPHRWRAPLAALPLLLAYLVQDLYFHVFGRVLRIIEVQELPEMFSVLPVSYDIALGAVFIAPLVVYGCYIEYRRPRSLLLGALPVVAVILAVEAMPGAYAGLVETVGNEIVFYSDGGSVENNGRLTMMLYNEARRSEARAATEPYRNPVAYEQAAQDLATGLKTQTAQPNVHIIVLESFIDPTLLKKAKFNRDPMHPRFRKLFADKLGLSISPVFGGATAEAEFEVLCGIPALRLVTSIEFNIFSGSQVNCTPRILGELGYRTVASNAFKPSFYNEKVAYRGLGFDETYFPREYSGDTPTYLQTGDVEYEHFMFDGDLFAQNLEFVRQHKQQHPEQPLLNYIMTVYGHTPHFLDESKRPQIVQIDAAHQDRLLLLATNQFYYRTQAIADYVEKLRELDPDSLIVMVADHVPPLVYGPITYRELDYLGNIENADHYNRLLILENGEPKTYPLLHHYDIQNIVYDFITSNAYCQHRQCSHRTGKSEGNSGRFLDEYYRLMAHATL